MPSCKNIELNQIRRKKPISKFIVPRLKEGHSKYLLKIKLLKIDSYQNI